MTEQVVVPRVAREGPSPLLVFGIIAMTLFIGGVDVAIVATALPAIHVGLRATINWASWVLTIYVLGSIVALPIAGKLSDQFGRRRVFLIALTMFTLSSLLSGLAPDIEVLIVFRAVQALGAGALLPSAAGLVADHLGENRDRAIGLFGTIVSVGQIVGPILGAVFVAYLSWRWIFFVNLPIGIVLVVMVIRFIPESRLGQRERLDVRGLALMTSFILAITIGVTLLGDGTSGVADPWFLILEACGIVLTYAFVRHIRSFPAPFITVRIIWGKGFAAVNTFNFLMGAATFGVASLIPFYAEQRYHLSTLKAGSLLTANAAGFIATGLVAAMALRRTGYRRPMYVGFTILALGTLMTSIAPRWGWTPFSWLFLSGTIIGLGMGVANPATRNACLHLAGGDVASVSGLRQTFIYLGIILNLAITSAILNRSADPGLTQSHVLWVVSGVVVFGSLPLIHRIPENRGNW